MRPRWLVAVPALTWMQFHAVPASGQGGVAARLNAPVTGAFGRIDTAEQPWEATVSWRDQESDRHFLEFPTGADNVVDTRTRYESGEYTRTVQTVDQSIQPGDGGFGVLLTYEAYRWISPERCSVYFAAAYLLNPEGTNGVSTYRSRPGEQIMSIADQYLARAGVVGMTRTG